MINARATERHHREHARAAMGGKHAAIVVGVVAMMGLVVAGPAAADTTTFAHGRSAGYEPAVALAGTVGTGIDAGTIVAYLGDSTYFDGDPHAGCQPRCVMALRISYQLHCTSTPGGPVINARVQDARALLTTNANGKESGQVYSIHGLASGFVCTLSFAARVHGSLNDPTQWKRLRVALQLRVPTS